MTGRTFGRRGGPWEFNLRDIFRWCDLVSQQVVSILYDHRSESVDLSYDVVFN